MNPTSIANNHRRENRLQGDFARLSKNLFAKQGRFSAPTAPKPRSAVARCAFAQNVAGKYGVFSPKNKAHFALPLVRKRLFARGTGQNRSFPENGKGHYS